MWLREAEQVLVLPVKISHPLIFTAFTKYQNILLGPHYQVSRPIVDAEKVPRILLDKKCEGPLILHIDRHATRANTSQLVVSCERCISLKDSKFHYNLEREISSLLAAWIWGTALANFEDQSITTEFVRVAGDDNNLIGCFDPRMYIYLNSCSPEHLPLYLGLVPSENMTDPAVLSAIMAGNRLLHDTWSITKEASEDVQRLRRKA